MYTVFISVPFCRITPQTCQVPTDWARSLLLLRDSLAGRFGQLTVAAPQALSGEHLLSQQIPQILDENRDCIRFVALGLTTWRARDFWLHYWHIRATCDHLARRSQIVHAGINDLYQPYALMGFQAARRAGKTTVFVLDGDAIARIRQLTQNASALQRLKSRAYCALYYRLAKAAVASADLALLKGRSLHARYARFASNPRDFYDTSYLQEYVIPQNLLDSKCNDILTGQPIRCLSLSRLMDFKGVDQTIQAVVTAWGTGAKITLDIIGQGPQEESLRQLVQQLAADHLVRFLGARSYGPELLAQIANYHLLLFTPTADETPRSLFDAMAGACALLAYDIPFAIQVVGQCQHGMTVPTNDIAALSHALQKLDRNRPLLVTMMQRARTAALEHSAQRWYQRRAQWTREAMTRRQHPPVEVPAAPRISIIIVNYRTPQLTIDCLRCLDEQVREFPGSTVIVVDNASPDASIQQITAAIQSQGWNSWASVMPLPRNGGFAWANNAAISQVLKEKNPPHYLLLLNPDTLPKPDAIRSLLQFMQTHPRVGIAGSRLEARDGTPQRSAFRFHSLPGELETALRLGIVSRILHRYVVAPPVPDKPSQTDWVCGACMMIRRQVLQSIGPLDDGYFMYFEETDFCLRARHHGFKTWYLPQSRVVHLVPTAPGADHPCSSAGPRRQYWLDSRRRYFVKNHGPLYALLSDILWASAFALWRVRRILQGSGDTGPPHLLADFLRRSTLLRGFKL